MKNMNVRFTALLIVMTLLLSACNASKKKDTQPNLNPEQAKTLAKEAWLFGMPLVMFEIQFDYSSYVTEPSATRAPVNQFVHYRKFVDASNRLVVGFNVDNLYSFASLDLSREPIILSVPPMGDRYWVMQIVDAWNGVPASPGSRTHYGDNAHDFLIAGPDWKGTAPDGVEVIQSPTELTIIAGRTYTPGGSDYAEVNTLQDQYKLTPLSDWGTPYVAPDHIPLKEGVDGETLVNTQLMALDAEQFFSNLNRLMATNPPYAGDAPMLKKLLPLGIEPGAPFSTASFSDELKAALEEGIAEAKVALAEEIKNLGEIINGWTLTYDMGRYGTKYIYRAAWTYAGIGGNLIEDAFYPFTVQDIEGNQLTSDKKYTLTFEAGEWPPAQAFWSLTMYDMEGYLVENPLNRYAVGDRSQMKPKADGSLTIYIQSESPGEDNESNWLPAPKSGDFKLFMRLYAPMEKVIDGSWIPPGIVPQK
jgi:hypothetical protein